VALDRLGRAIQVMRAREGLSRRDLAERAGLSYSYLSEIEAGRKTASSNALVALARAFGMKPGQFLSAADQELEEPVVHAMRGSEPPLDFAEGAPLSSAEMPMDRMASMPAPPPPAAKRILWVDDHPDWNRWEVAELENLGFAITQATSTEAALDYLERLPFDLVITDLARGDDREAGLKLIEKIQEAHSGLPTLVYTAEPGARAQRARRLGAPVSTGTAGVIGSVLGLLGSPQDWRRRG
jgi:transcriptional regulator with XRE-family HTH domain